MARGDHMGGAGGGAVYGRPAFLVYGLLHSLKL
jgi:hypothetical protein